MPIPIGRWRSRGDSLHQYTSRRIAPRLAKAVTSREAERGPMMTSGFRLLALSIAAILTSGAAIAASAADAWNPEAAARYLDSREADWQAWDRPHKDNATLCISCHTQASYGLSRPTLHKALRDGQSPAEQAFLASIQKRVSNWKAM